MVYDAEHPLMPENDKVHRGECLSEKIQVVNDHCFQSRTQENLFSRSAQTTFGIEWLL